jgi:glycosyltransferase involved in cell wall biosynthesis
MRIAQVAPLTESVPPRTYGGTERVVSYLTESLVALGHDVTLYASGDTQTSATLRPGCPRSLRTDPEAGDTVLVHLQMMQNVLAESQNFDVIHFHTGWCEFPIFADHSTPCLATLHGPLDVPDVQARLRQVPDFPFVSISNSQRLPLPTARWLGTVYHGLPEVLPDRRAGSRDYLAFVGRICPEKRPDLAIEIARRSGLKLKIAAKVDRVDQAYFETVIQPLLALPDIEYVGELDEAEKMAFLAGARALVFPIDWPEPFGLVMIEAMACGTPVVAYRRGSVPEVVEDGVTGYIVEDIAGAVAAMSRLDRLDRGLIRAEFQRRFSAPRMAHDYVALYRKLLGQQRDRGRLPPSARERRPLVSRHQRPQQDLTDGPAAASDRAL